MNNGPASASPFFQAKLTVNTPGDAHEQEADAVADQVMRMKTGDAPIVQRTALTPVSSVQRACAACEHEREHEKEGIQRKETSGGDASGKAAPSVVSDVLSSGGGQPMDGGTKQFMESRFGQDFSQVRIHTDARAAESASAIQARAYTSGRDVVFGNGEYQPGSEGGRRLLAHELVHVGQQGGIQRTIQRLVCADAGTESRIDNEPFIRLIHQYEQEGRVLSAEAADLIARSSARNSRMGRRDRCAIIREIRTRPRQTVAHSPSPATPVTTPAPAPQGGGTFALSASNYRDILRRHFRGDALAERVLRDMIDSHEPLNFTDESELVEEVNKRVRTSRAMQESQDGRQVRGRHATAFGYPFNPPAIHYGPRVNYAARGYWTPTVVDNYAVRNDRAKIRQMEALPRSRRHEVYGDPVGGSYSWRLSTEGQRDPYHATMNLFTHQTQPHKRSLIHCDYLVSLVQMKAFIESMTPAEFNRRVAAFGVSRFILQWDAFNSLREFYDDPATPAVVEPGFGSTQRIEISREEDFIIGDHVYFYNHAAYDVINDEIGNAWRLENTILIDRNRGHDIFLGHGSGRKTKDQLFAKLAEEYNDVVNIALPLSRRVDRRQTGADAEMRRRFPKLSKVGSQWRILGTGIGGRAVDFELRPIAPREVLGLEDPWNPGHLRPIRRPIESR